MTQNASQVSKDSCFTFYYLISNTIIILLFYYPNIIALAKKNDKSLSHITTLSDSDDNHDEILLPFSMYSDSVKRRSSAAKKLHEEYKKLQEEYLAERAKIQTKYQNTFQEISLKREKIISGEYEPTGDDLSSPQSLGATQPEDSAPPEQPKGIPNFWFTALMNNHHLSHYIYHYDIPILRMLVSVRSKETLLTDEQFEKADKEFFMGKISKSEARILTLEFEFSSNPYFSDTILRKELLISKTSEGDVQIYSNVFSPESHNHQEGKGSNFDERQRKNQKQTQEKDDKKGKGKQGAKNQMKSTVPESIHWKKNKKVGVEKVTISERQTVGKGKKIHTQIVQREVTLFLPSFFDFFLTSEELIAEESKCRDTEEFLFDKAIQRTLIEKWVKEQRKEELMAKQPTPFQPISPTPSTVPIPQLNEQTYRHELKHITRFLHAETQGRSNAFLNLSLLFSETLIPNAYLFFARNVILERGKRANSTSSDPSNAKVVDSAGYAALLRRMGEFDECHSDDSDEEEDEEGEYEYEEESEEDNESTSEDDLQ